MSVTDLQDLKELNRIKQNLNIDEDTIIDQTLVSKINNNPLQIENRLKGLEKEDEFGLYLLTTNIEQMVILKQQKQFVNKERYIIPDFLVSFRLKDKAQRMFIEVKSTKSKKFTISEYDYKRLRNFCELYSLPLYFAIYIDDIIINQFSLISGKLLIEKSIQQETKHNNRKQICYTINWNDLLKLDCSGLWMENLVIVIKNGTEISHIYDKTKKMECYNQKYGGLIELKIKNKDTKKQIIMNNKIEPLIYHIILNILSTKLAKKQIISNDNITETKYIYEDNVLIPFNTFILNAFIYFKNLPKENEFSKTYLLDNFNETDYNLILHLKYYTSELVRNKHLFAFKNTPNLEK